MNICVCDFVALEQIGALRGSPPLPNSTQDKPQQPVSLKKINLKMDGRINFYNILVIIKLAFSYIHKAHLKIHVNITLSWNLRKTN